MGTDRDRTLAQLGTLRPVEFHILLSLAGGERHGYGILQDARARGEAVPDIGTMYRALARMVDQGWIETTDAVTDADERRKHYRLTDLGLRVAKAEARRLDALTRAARVGGLLRKEAK
jgi:DNA-binding PadR family transcriptional regulator